MTENRRQIGWWYDGPEPLADEERFVDMKTAEEEGPVREPYVGHMVPVWIEEGERGR